MSMSPVLIPFPKDIKREKSNAGNEQNETVASNINEVERFHIGTGQWKRLLLLR